VTNPSGFAMPSSPVGYCTDPSKFADTPTFADDFLNNTLSPSKWESKWSGPAGGDCFGYYLPSHVTTPGDSLLHIEAKWESTLPSPCKCSNKALSGAAATFVTGGVGSTNYETFGLWVVCKKRTGFTPPQIDDISCIYPPAPLFPPEVDFAEDGANDAQIGAYIHYSPQNKSVGLHMTPPQPLTDWNVWTLEWVATNVGPPHFVFVETLTFGLVTAPDGPLETWCHYNARGRLNPDPAAPYNIVPYCEFSDLSQMPNVPMHLVLETAYQSQSAPVETGDTLETQYDWAVFFPAV